MHSKGIFTTGRRNLRFYNCKRIAYAVACANTTNKKDFVRRYSWKKR